MKCVIDVPKDRVKDGRLRVFIGSEDCLSRWFETGIMATPYEEPSDTAEDAWKMIRHVLKYADDGGMSVDDLEECFGTNNLSHIGEMSYVEVRERYDAWKKKKEEIHVGDELARNDNEETAIVTRVLKESEAFDGFGKNGEVYKGYFYKFWHKTGRHFEKAVELLDQMRESE